MSMNNQCAGMADISHKTMTQRRAVAEGTITFQSEGFAAFTKQGSPKGDIFETAKIAGIMAAKSTPNIIPLCHPLPLEKVKVGFEVSKQKKSVNVTVEVLCTGKTGVEMEALAAVSAACLTIYDMMKWAGQDMVISNIRLMHKSGGKSGVFQR